MNHNKPNKLTKDQNNNTHNIIKQLNENIKKHNIVVTSADKSNSIVLLNKDKYVEKVKNFIEKEKAIPIRDPTPTVDKDVRSFLKKEGTELIQHPQSLINKNPHAPSPDYMVPLKYIKHQKHYPFKKFLSAQLLHHTPPQFIFWKRNLSAYSNNIYNGNQNIASITA
ncbi:hypothetical protein M8J77_001649 [Diaphorina citri]|nr:hypothetical protein M8J77_001649 [Diaphorina citri]